MKQHPIKLCAAICRSASRRCEMCIQHGG